MFSGCFSPAIQNLRKTRPINLANAREKMKNGVLVGYTADFVMNESRVIWQIPVLIDCRSTKIISLDERKKSLSSFSRGKKSRLEIGKAYEDRISKLTINKA